MNGGGTPTQTGNGATATTHDERWLIVGDDALNIRVRDAVALRPRNASIRSVGGFLAALGELAVEPADVIIGCVDVARGMVAPTARAVHELCPQARLLLVTAEDEAGEGEAAVRQGFNGYVTLPVDATKLARALGEPPPHVERRGLRATQLDFDALDPFGRPRHAAPPEPPPGEDEELGDTDLIQTILQGGNLRDRAMHIVRTRSAIEGIAWTDDEAAVPPTHASQHVHLRGRDFGILHAPPPADDAALDGWAGWLAHWLALDEQMRLLKDMSMRDALTGVWNRRYFDRFLTRTIEWAAQERSQVTLLVFDIDDFKLYNDKYGHAAGDEILRETSRLMQSVVREHDVVARIGGDEFAVIFWDADPRKPRTPNSKHPEDVVSAARRFQKAILEHKFPKLLNEAPGTLTISGGLASFPWDGRTPEALLCRADEMALQSKRLGKNAITFGPGAERAFREGGA